MFKRIISSFVVIALFLCLPFIVSAQDYGSGSIGMNLEFNNQAPSKFTVNSVKVNGYDWSSSQDNYFVDTRQLTVVLNVTPTGEAVPKISHCGDECGNAYKVSIETSGSNYTITVTITNPEQDFVTFDLIEDEGTGNNPDEPGQPRMCQVTYQMNGGNPIDPVDFVCGNPAPPPSSDQIKNGDNRFIGWFANPSLTEEYNFDVNENDNVTVYAGWEGSEGEEPRYRLTFDFNGAKDSEGRTGLQTESVAFVPMIVSELFIDEMGVIPPEGYHLAYIEINGKRYEVDKDQGYELNKDSDFVYIWVDKDGKELVVEKKEVSLTTNSGFSVTFEGKEGEEYNLTVVDVLTLKKEQLAELGVTEEEYNQIKDKIVTAVKQYGNVLNVFTIEVDYRGMLYEGPVQIKVKMTEEMKKYNKFRFVYIDENNNFKVGEIVDVKVEGEYLVGTLPHLSVYAVVGEYVEENNPKTSDSVIINIVMLVLCLIGLTSTVIYIKKHKLIRL